MEAKRRGRPPNTGRPKLVSADRVIGKTVYHLLLWGFPKRTIDGRAGVCEVVGLKAAQILKRDDGGGRALGEDRIEQIFEAWFVAEQKARTDARRWPLRGYSSVSKDSRAERRPDKRMSLEELAVELLQHDGEPTRTVRIVATGDYALTSKAARLLGPTPKFSKTG